MKKREWNASFTVEASVYIPLLISFYLFAMRTGIELYTGTKELAEQIQAEERIDVKKLFYWKENIGDLLGHGD